MSIGKSINMYCECGCRQIVSPGKRFVIGHSSTRPKRMNSRVVVMKLCECGCGEYANDGKGFILGHNARVKHHWHGKKLSEEHKRKMSVGLRRSDKKKGTNHPNYKHGRNIKSYSTAEMDEPKESVRKLYNKCAICGLSREDSLKKYNEDLNSHHWKYNRDSTSIGDMVTLCFRCHTNCHTGDNIRKLVLRMGFIRMVRYGDSIMIKRLIDS